MKILLIDDQGLIRESIALQLKLLDDSYDVSSCGELDEARKVIGASPPDIIFLDIDFNNDSTAGLRFLDELKEGECESRIMMLSSDDDPTTVGAAIASGAVGFITKSARDSSSMRRAIEMVVQGGVYISEELKNRRRGESPPPGHGPISPSMTIQTVGPAELGVTAKRIYEVLWHLSNGVKGYKLVARKMGISESVAEEYAREGYSKMNVRGKDGFLVMLSQKGWKLSAPRGTP